MPTPFLLHLDDCKLPKIKSRPDRVLAEATHDARYLRTLARPDLSRLPSIRPVGAVVEPSVACVPIHPDCCLRLRHTAGGESIAPVRRGERDANLIAGEYSGCVTPICLGDAVDARPRRSPV
jgi:hypothetical protein